LVKVELIEYTKDGEKLVALAAKRSLSGEPAQDMTLTEEEVETWILESLRRQHWSPWEFSWYVFEVECSRTCTHQLVRHRIASYAQVPQRCGLSTLKHLLRNVVARVGPDCREDDYMCLALAVDRFEKLLKESKENRVAEDELMEVVEQAFYVPYQVKMDREVYREYTRHFLASLKLYLVLLNKGIRYEDARLVLPQAVKPRVLVAMNARELATSFLPLSMCARAQEEIREVAWRLWHMLVSVHPRLFRYVGPRCLMMENAARERPIALRDLLKEDSSEELTIERCPELVPKKTIKTCVHYAYRATYKLL